ncbi:MAG: hypothetical protein A2039_02665 [Candidatus Melainabacteria bacterium GWA2_34_9]|nr:MAG: hypothetical protein A2039_02665 [Candidatus Melainabacteria bacterium GWA2_34_9]
MSHIHIPDGILPLWLWVLGYILIGIFFIIEAFYIKKSQKQAKFSLISIMAALMLLTMSIPIPFPVPYHINLSVLTGIILGPTLAFFAIFTSNLLLVFIAHGGITVIGLNTLVIGIEASLGYYAFKFLYKKTDKIFFSAFTATFFALIISTFLTIGIVYAGTHNFSTFSNSHCSSKGVHQEKLSVHNEKHLDNEQIEQQKHNKTEEKFNIKRFLSLMFIFGLIGWILESSLTGFIVSYIKRVKPDILHKFEKEKDIEKIKNENS